MQHKGIKLFFFVTSFCLLFLPLVFCLTSCAPLDETDVVNALLPNLWVFLSHLFATVVLLGLTVWMIWKPTKKALAKRREYIEREIRDTENARRAAFEKLAEAEQTKIDAYLRAQQIIDHAVGQAYKQKESIELEAKENLKKIQIDASNEVAKLKQSMQEDVEKQILNIAFNATEALLQKKITQKENQKLVQKFIKELNGNKRRRE